jgi:hypothetical protein
MFRSVTSEPKNLILARAAELAPPEAARDAVKEDAERCHADASWREQKARKATQERIAVLFLAMQHPLAAG